MTVIDKLKDYLNNEIDDTKELIEAGYDRFADYCILKNILEKLEEFEYESKWLGKLHFGHCWSY